MNIAQATHVLFALWCFAKAGRLIPGGRPSKDSSGAVKEVAAGNRCAPEGGDQ